MNVRFSLWSGFEVGGGWGGVVFLGWVDYVLRI